MIDHPQRIWLSLLVALFSGLSSAQASIPGYPKEVVETEYLSSIDKTKQAALFYAPEIAKPVPLLVALHTWSSGYKQAGGEANYAKWCIEAGWCFIHPNFRGPNYTKQAMGSDFVVQDILSSIDHAKQQAQIDESRIYCIGVSGGGHASLLMAGRAPEIWAGVSAWCGISDIEKWHAQCKGTRFGRYANHIEKALGAAPNSSKEALADARHRSPVTWLANARNVTLDINHGIHDGRSGSVPFTHSLHAWNAVVPGSQQMEVNKVQAFYKSQKPPSPEPAPDALYGKKQPRFRKTCQNTRITIFEGGHEILHHAALNWLAAQRKGEPAVWEIKTPEDYLKGDANSESGK